MKKNKAGIIMLSLAAAAAVLTTVYFVNKPVDPGVLPVVPKTETATPSEVSGGESGSSVEAPSDIKLDTADESSLNTPDTKPSKKTYINDTIYTSENKGGDKTEKSDAAVDTDLYRYAFHKRDNITGGKLYIPNKEFIAKLSPEMKERIQTLGNNYMNAYFISGYKAVAADKDAYIKKLQSYKENLAIAIHWEDPEDTEIHFVSKNEYLEHHVQWFIDNEVQADVKIKTDDSLIWYDRDTTFIRYEVDIKPYSNKAEKMPRWFLDGIDYIHGGRYVVDLAIAYLSPKNYNTTEGVNDLFVRDMQVIGTLEEYK